jgi:hypothetical protein
LHTDHLIAIPAKFPNSRQDPILQNTSDPFTFLFELFLKVHLTRENFQRQIEIGAEKKTEGNYIHYKK